MTMQTYTVFPIEPHPSSPHTKCSDSLPSKSTRTPSFLPTHARWPSQRTFVASVMDASISHARNHIDKDAGERAEWMGTASIVGPSGLMMTPFILAPLKAAGLGNDWEICVLYVMWAHPAHRGEGVGVELVNACLEWARTNVDVKFSSKNSGDFEKVVLLVYDDNVAGRALYSRAGFIDLEGVSGREGQRWMLVKV